MNILDDWIPVLIGGGAVTSLLAGWWRWVRPRAKRTVHEVAAIRDSILGREAVVDSITGAELSPALPGVGVRLAETEKHLGVLAEAVATIAESHVRLEDHEGRIAALEHGAIERIVSRVDSAAAWAAMQAAYEAQPTEGIDGPPGVR